jgi:hypothetical protein
MTNPAESLKKWGKPLDSRIVTAQSYLAFIVDPRCPPFPSECAALAQMVGLFTLSIIYLFNHHDEALANHKKLDRVISFE